MRTTVLLRPSRGHFERRSMRRRVCTGECGWAICICPHAIKFTSSLQVPQRKEHLKWICSIALQETIRGTHENFWNLPPRSQTNLDRPLSAVVEMLPWREPPKLFDNFLKTSFSPKRYGRPLSPEPMPNIQGTPKSQQSPAAMAAQLEKTDLEFNRIFGDVRNRGRWDSTLVDALSCRPRHSLSVASSRTHDVQCRSAIDGSRRAPPFRSASRGVRRSMEYEQSVAPWDRKASAVKGN